MKYRSFLIFSAGIAGLLLALASCDERPIHSSYRLLLPELPNHWEEILGEGAWRLEWIDESGGWREWEGRGVPVISVLSEWCTPVLAWPYWPEKGLFPGMMRPCGALFPWDHSGETIALTWKGGAEAVFWKEMAQADRPDEKSQERLPWYFDWPRFRELLGSSSIPESVRGNPWLADWKLIAQKTVLSGFDRRRIVSRSLSELTIPGMHGRWIGTSPFEPPLEADGSLNLYVTNVPDAWVSESAVLKCSNSGWVYREL